MIQHPPNGKRITIAQVMIVVAALAVLLALPRDAVLQRIVGIFGLVVLFPLLASRRLAQLLERERCRSCAHGSLLRVAVRSFGCRYYRCDLCDARSKRGLLGFWHDASGKKDDRYYRGRVDGDPWSNGSVRPDLENALAGTHGSLLKSKRERVKDDPRIGGRECPTEEPDDELGVS